MLELENLLIAGGRLCVICGEWFDCYQNMLKHQELVHPREFEDFST